MIAPYRSLRAVVIAATVCLAITCPSHGLAHSNIQTDLDTARELFQAQKHAEAEDHLQKLLDRHGRKGSGEEIKAATVLLGRVSATRGDPKRAEQLYQEVLREDGAYAPAHHALAKLYSFQRRNQEAMQHFKEAVALDSDNAEAYQGMGRLAAAMGDDTAAYQHFTRSLEIDPNNAMALFDLGTLAIKQGDLEGSRRLFARAGDANSKLDMAVVAEIYKGFGDLAGAHWAYEQAVEKFPRNGQLQFKLGEVAEALGHQEQALVAYTKAYKAEPQLAQAYLRKGQLLTGCGLVNYGAQQACGINAEEAMDLYQRALDIDPSLDQAANALRFCQKELQEAERWAKRAGELRQSAPKGAKHRPKGNERGSSEEPDWVTKLGGYLTLPVVNITSGEQLMQEYVLPSRPAVVQNFQDGFAPLDAWSWDALVDKFGSNLVHVSLSQTGRFDGPEDGSLWGLPGKQEVLVRPPGTSMRMRDFVTLLQANLTETFYLEYLAVHQYLGTRVQEMIPLPSVAAESGLELLLTNLWIGKGGTTAVLHYDDYENLLCQIRGTKELVLFPPSELGNLYYIGRRKGVLEYEYPATFKRERLANSSAVVFSSSVRLDDPDFRRHPKFRGRRPYKVVLHPGDVLYMPAYWHHEVKSHPDDGGANMAVNFWFRNATHFAEENQLLASTREEL